MDKERKRELISKLLEDPNLRADAAKTFKEAKREVKDPFFARMLTGIDVRYGCGGTPVPHAKVEIANVTTKDVDELLDLNSAAANESTRKLMKGYRCDYVVVIPEVFVVLSIAALGPSKAREFVAAVIRHELAHVGLGHIQRLTGMHRHARDSREGGERFVNIAIDCIVNQAAWAEKLTGKFVEPPEEVDYMFYPGRRWRDPFAALLNMIFAREGLPQMPNPHMFDLSDMPKGLSAEATLNWLLENVSQDEREGAGEGQDDEGDGESTADYIPGLGGATGGIDSHEVEVVDGREGDALDVPTNQALDEAEERAKATTRRAYEAASKMPGSGSCPFLEEVRAALEPPKVPWTQVLRRWARRVASALEPEGTWYRRSRRCPDFAPGYRLDGQVVRAVAYIDQSGSMGTDELASILVELRGLVDVGVEVLLVAFDTEVVELGDVRDVRELRTLTRKLRGGTDVNPCMDHFRQLSARDRTYAGAVVFTDGEIPKVDMSGMRRDQRFLFVVTEGGNTDSIPKGRNVVWTKL